MSTTTLIKPDTAMTERDNRRLKVLEDGIRDGAGTIYQNLRAIHDEKLYRAAHETFEDYCETRWKMSRDKAYRLLNHGKLMDLLGAESAVLPIGNISESAVRELVGLTDAEKVEVIKEAAVEASETNGKVTAAKVKRVVRKRKPKPKPPAKEREPGDESEHGPIVDAEPHLKSLGKLMRFLDDAQKARVAINTVKAARDLARELHLKLEVIKREASK